MIPGRSSSRHPLKLSLMLTLAFFSIACLPQTRENPYSDLPGSTEVRVTIRNESPRARDVYAIWEGASRDWLGVVPAESTETFTIVYRSSGIRFSGGPRVFVAVYPGDQLEMVFPRVGQVFPPRRLRPS